MAADSDASLSSSPLMNKKNPNRESSTRWNGESGRKRGEGTGFVRVFFVLIFGESGKENFIKYARKFVKLQKNACLKVV